MNIPICKECPPGACVCQREKLLADPQADLRILQPTEEEEKKRLEQPTEHLPGTTEVPTVRGFDFQVAEQPGLCRKTKESMSAAVRRCLKATPAIAFEMLDADGLWGGVGLRLRPTIPEKSGSSAYATCAGSYFLYSYQRG